MARGRRSVVPSELLAAHGMGSRPASEIRVSESGFEQGAGWVTRVLAGGILPAKGISQRRQGGGWGWWLWFSSDAKDVFLTCCVCCVLT